MIKEWKTWLNETKPTEKYFGDVSRNTAPNSPKNQHYNRAVTDSMRQKDFRATFKVWLGQFMENSSRDGDIEYLAAHASPEDSGQAIKDLNVMRYIYSGRSNYEITTRDNLRTGIMYNNQPSVSGSPIEKIDFALEQFGSSPTLAEPSPEEQEEVYIYYIHPNWSLTKGPEPSPELKSRFKKNIALTQTSDFMKRQAELDALNRQKAIERKREIARRRERRRNK